MRRWLTAGMLGLVLASATPRAAVGQAGGIRDSRLRAATEYVLKSDRYLHHSKLRRGQIGYGLTVLSGTKIVRFEAEVVSVIENFSPQQAVILVRLRGQGLVNSGIISGMSGSPVFMKDGGKDKMIGAVAYGWRAQKSTEAGPLGGVQPITQMLATVDGPMDHPPKAQPKASAGDRPAERPARLSAAWRAAAFEPRKVDFARFGFPERKPYVAAGAPQLRPLSMPLMTGGLGESTRGYLTRMLGGSGMVLVPAGAPSALQVKSIKGVKLERGSALAIPLATGDADLTGIGTVTEVVGDRVLGFGHPMYGSGKTSFPMATGYIHTVVPGLLSSFKLGGTLKVVGELNTDESAAVGGVVGRKVAMIPVTVNVAWDRGGHRQTFRYHIVNDRQWTPMLANVVISRSLAASREMPREHTLEYSVTVDFGELGTYKAANHSSNSGGGDLLSDMSRPVALLMNNPFGQARVRSIVVNAKVHEGAKMANVLGVTLDRNTYAPGETIRAEVTLQKYRGPRFTRTIEVVLPDDLPDGSTTLSVGGSQLALHTQQTLRPRDFDPRNMGELLAAVGAMARWRADKLYAMAGMPGVDLVVNTEAMADVPATIAAAIKAASPLEVSMAPRAVTAELPMGLHVGGMARAKVVVRRSPPRP